MAITNQSKPTPSLTNSAKVSIGETWSTIPTTWATETRTWIAVSKLIGNINRPAAGFTYLLQEDGYHLLQENGSRILLDITGAITNQPKP